MEPLVSRNPFTNVISSVYEQHSSKEVEEIIVDAHEQFTQWASIRHSDRCQKLAKLADALETHKTTLALLITHEMGKPVREAEAEISKCALLCRHYSKPESSLIPSETINTEATELWLTYEPIGVIFAIMPWNFPFWQALRFAVPTLCAGNTVVLKHAPNVSGCAIAIEKLFLEAGFPKHTFTTIIIDADRSEELISHPLVRGVTLTGSEQAGKAVAALSGKYLKKVMLELGGSDPFIIFDDADFLSACTTGLSSRMTNAGQVCIAAKRFIVHESIFEAFIAFQHQALMQLKAGDPLDYTTDIGPMARPDLVDKIEKQVQESVEKGAQLICGGQRSSISPMIYLPTLLINVPKDAPVFFEETFGPVMIAIPFSSEQEAIELANDTRFGLGASIWTRDVSKAKRIAQQVQAGAVFINSIVKSDARVPFGGTKNSGFGKELALAGIKEFMILKTNWLA